MVCVVACVTADVTAVVITAALTVRMISVTVIRRAVGMCAV